jgi:uncharacterized damage-inducible protein DinB
MTETSIKDVALADLDHELNLTRHYLERVPKAHLDWRPHDRSMSLGELATHIASVVMWQVTILEHDFFDLSEAPPRMEPLSSVDKILELFDRNAATLRERVEAVGDEALTTPWELRRGEHHEASMPRAAALRAMGLSHVIHHRGQLSVYLRLLDVPLPPAYGPTADEAVRS